MVLDPGDSTRPTAAGVKAAGAGKKSYLFSPEEQKAIASGMGKLGSKLKLGGGAKPSLKKTSPTAKPKVAAVFSEVSSVAGMMVRLVRKGVIVSCISNALTIDAGL